MRFLTASKISLMALWWKTAWSPPSRASVTNWLEEHITLSRRVTSYPGKYSTNLTPYARGIYEDFSNPEVREQIMCFGAQVTKTQIMINCLAFRLANDPMNAIWMMPSEDLAGSFSKSRLKVIIDDNEVLNCHKLSDRNMYGKLEMIFDNMTLNLVGANSPAQAASRPAGFLLLDEVDKYPSATQKEADPLSLIKERKKWFPNHKILIASTPTHAAGQIWSRYLAGDQRKYYVPCPHCEHKFVFKWKHFKWEPEGSIDERAESVCCICPGCGGAIYENDHKDEMVANGEWIAENPNAPKSVRSYQLSELYSPRQISSWKGLVVKWLEAEEKVKAGDMSERQNFINSTLGEPWDPQRGKGRKVEALRQLEDERPRGLVPKGIVGLAAGVDTQDNGFYYTIRAFEPGALGRSYLIQQGFLESFDAIKKVIEDGVFLDADGKKWQVDVAMQDSAGHNTADVYTFCRGKGHWYLPIIGKQSMAQPTKVTHLDQYPDGTRIKEGLKLINVNTKYFKDILASKMNLKFDEPGAFLFYKDCDEAYYKQLTAEYVNDDGVWECKGHVANHLWDCEVYCYAAYVFSNMMNRELPEEDEVEEKPVESHKEVNHANAIKQALGG